MKQVNEKNMLMKKIVSKAKEHYVSAFSVDTEWLKNFSIEELKCIDGDIRFYEDADDGNYYDEDYDENNREHIGSILEFAKYCAEFKKTDLQNLKNEYKKSRGYINVYSEYDDQTDVLSSETRYVMENYPNMVELFKNVCYPKEYMAPSYVTSDFVTSCGCDNDSLRTNKWVPIFIKKQEEKFTRMERAEKAAANKKPVVDTPAKVITDAIKANSGRE
jgi:hypothetical protein